MHLGRGRQPDGRADRKLSTLATSAEGVGSRRNIDGTNRGALHFQIPPPSNYRLNLEKTQIGIAPPGRLPNPPAGVLCREFLSAHLSPTTPVVMSGSSGYDGDGDASSAVVLGGLRYDEELHAQSAPVTPKKTTPTKPPPSETSSTSSSSSSTTSSTLAVSGTTNGTSVVPAAGEPAASTCDGRAAAAGAGGIGGASETETLPRSRVGAGSKQETKTREPGREGGALDPTEDVCTDVDVCTVGDLYPWRNIYGVTGRGELLRLGFLRQQVGTIP